MATTQDRVPRGTQGGDSDSPRVKIRPAIPTDLDAIAELELHSFSNPWHPDTFRSLLKQPRALVLAAEDPIQGVVGYAVLWWVLDQGELANLAVGEDQRGRGIGSSLLDRAVTHAMSQGVESLFLEVRVSNESALGLYKSRGFAQISIRRGYYQNPPEDALVLVKHLVPAFRTESDGFGVELKKNGED